MCKKLIFLICSILLFNPVGRAKADGIHIDIDGMVVIEGENFTGADHRSDPMGYEWRIRTDFGGFAGTGYVDTPYGTGTDGTWENGCEMTYTFKVSQDATYTVWLRRNAAVSGWNDSCFIGLDGVQVGNLDNTANYQQWIWVDRGTMDVTAGIHTFHLRRLETGYYVDRILFTTNPDYEPTGQGPEEILVFERAFNPDPVDGVEEVSRDAYLSWSPGDFANAHDVYFGTVFEDVNLADRANPLNVQVIQDQDVSMYDPEGLLDWGQTYYWRVDDITQSEVVKGEIWSFTAEPIAYPIPSENIIASASSSAPGQEPENTVNGSGMNADDLHSSNITKMWASSTDDPGPIWIQYEFNIPYKLHEMRIWNYNGEGLLSAFGLKEVTVEYSVNGVDWTSIESTIEFAAASGKNNYAYNTTVDFRDNAVKFIRINVISNQGGGGFFNQYGLSEVRFYIIPLSARIPSPDIGATDVSLDVSLGWRAGREAAEHNVYISDDLQAVIDGTAPQVTINQADYGPLLLKLGSTYFWRVDEVNNAESITTWQGDIWSFSTQEYLVVEDFESYNDIVAGQDDSNLVYLTWIDGYDNPATNGSTIGYPTGASMETTIVHGGSQSVPLMYDNSTASRSEVTINPVNLAIGRDWNIGAENLVLWIYGDPNNTTTEQMYVKVNNAKHIVSNIDLTATSWQSETVDLVALGINLSDVTSLTIGFERTVTTGGSGLVLIDDIQLYAPLNDQAVITAWQDE